MYTTKIECEVTMTGHQFKEHFAGVKSFKELSRRAEDILFMGTTTEVNICFDKVESTGILVYEVTNNENNA